jgi:predicted secreted protein
MKKIRQIAFAILISAIISSAAFAGDYAHFHFIGFSKDGKYLAFEEYGINDDIDDASAYSSIYIVNVEKNRFAVSPLKANGISEKEDEDSVRNRNKRRAAKQLKRFGIVDGNTGLQVAAHLINEYPNGDQNKPAPGEAKLLPQQVAFTKRGNPLYRDGYFEVKLKPVSVKQVCGGDEGDWMSFELTLKNERDETRILQKAEKVSKNRGCPNDYGIQEAFIYQNKLAVFVGIFTNGWEGDNLRLIAVTGELDD